MLLRDVIALWVRNKHRDGQFASVKWYCFLFIHIIVWLSRKLFRPKTTVIEVLNYKSQFTDTDHSHSVESKSLRMSCSTMLMLTVLIFGSLLLAVKGKTSCISHPITIK